MLTYSLASVFIAETETLHICNIVDLSCCQRNIVRHAFVVFIIPVNVRLKIPFLSIRLKLQLIGL